MGYTHYFKLLPGAYDQQEYNRRFAEAADFIKELAEAATKELGIVLKGGFGGQDNDPLPEFTPMRIWFNGDASENLDHETFYVPLDTDPEEFTFCKTARKPYDLVVCCALLALRTHLPKAFSFSSDGDLNDTEWQDALQFFNNHGGNFDRSELEEILG